MVKVLTSIFQLAFFNTLIRLIRLMTREKILVLGQVSAHMMMKILKYLLMRQVTAINLEV